MGLQAKSQDIIDLGTGTGTLARGFALRGAKAIGINPDLRLLAEAKKLDSLMESQSYTVSERPRLFRYLTVRATSSQQVNAGIGSMS
jgi:predicted RNA methylase